MSNYTAILLAVLIGYILINFVVGIYISKKRVSLQEKGGFISHYFIGNRCAEIGRASCRERV